jgi:membrane protease YdiL (CAAX protease family)
MSPLTPAERIMPQLSGWASLMAWCSVAVVGPAFEEVLFRGCLFGRFRVHGYVASGAVLSGLAFSVAHGTPMLMPKYFCNGLILAWVCHRTGSLWPPFAVHVGWNIFALRAFPALHPAAKSATSALGAFFITESIPSFRPVSDSYISLLPIT